MFRDSEAEKQAHMSSASVPTVGCEDAITRRCTLPQPMGPMLMILIASHEREDLLYTANEEPTHTTLDHPEAQSEAQNLKERKDEGIVTDRPPETPLEHIADDDNINKDTHDTAHPGTSQGVCQ